MEGLSPGEKDHGCWNASKLANGEWGFDKKSSIKVSSCSCVTGSRNHVNCNNKRHRCSDADSSETEVSSERTTYVKGKFLGKGGFAHVHELVDLSSRIIYAGKIIPKNRITKPFHIQKIAKEISIHRNLVHKNVVRLHHYFEDKLNAYIVLENCSRKSLFRVLKHRYSVTEPEARFYLRQLVEGVNYIHSQKVIHRDLKPGNMLLSEDMTVKLGDFGLATLADGNMKGSLCGTPNYMAPEVLKKLSYSYEADVWAIGCILYVMLVGQPPFETASLKETYTRIVDNNYTIPLSLPESARKLIRQLLHPQPENRILIDKINSHEFFKNGYTPETLSPSCCYTAPLFSNYNLQRQIGSDSGAMETLVSTLQIPVTVLAATSTVVTTTAAGGGDSGTAAATITSITAPTAHTSKTTTITTTPTITTINFSTPSDITSTTACSIHTTSTAPTTSITPSFSITSSTSITPSTSIIPSSSITPSTSIIPSSSITPSTSIIPSSSITPSTSTSITPSTSTIPSTSITPTTGIALSTCVALTSATALTTTVAACVVAPTTTIAPVTSIAPTTTVAPTTTIAPSISLAPNITAALATSIDPTASVAPTASIVSSSSTVLRSPVITSTKTTNAPTTITATTSSSVSSRSNSSSNNNKIAAFIAFSSTSTTMITATSITSTKSTAVCSNSTTNTDKKAAVCDIPIHKHCVQKNAILTKITLKQKLSSVLCPDKIGKKQENNALFMYNVVMSCLRIMPPPTDEPQSNPSAVIFCPIFVSKWIDYSNKYGFGFQLSDKSVGVLFNDNTRISFSSDRRQVEFHDINGKITAHPHHSVPEPLHQRLALLEYFSLYMQENLTDGGYVNNGANAKQKSPILQMKRWVRTSAAIVMELSNGTLQINFFKDHTKIILSAGKHGYVVTYINSERQSSSYLIHQIAHTGSEKNIWLRLKFAAAVLREFAELDGENV